MFVKLPTWLNTLLNKSGRSQATVKEQMRHRIGKRYLAVTLDVKNPTAQKLQFNKSAVYFDVDYIEAQEKRDNEFNELALGVFTLGIVHPSPYAAPFVARENGRVFRFGLEQNVKHSPISYLAALGSFDETTERTQQEFDTIQLLASIMNTIATGGIAGGPSFRSASSLLSGVFLPGLKGIVLNDSRINRYRSNLVTQTLQEVIEVPAGGSASTVVLLPRNGILDFDKAKIPVMIERVIDVHLEPEVVTPVTTPPIEKGVCKPGYTKDQTRQALGEPAGVNTSADGTSVFTYPTGPITSASFDTKALLVSCVQRPPTDQLGQATTLVELNQTLTALKLTSTQIKLTDESIVVTDIPGVTSSFHFDSKGNKAPDYALLFSAISAKKGSKKSDFDTFLETQAKALFAARADEITKQAEAAQDPKNPAKIGKPVQYSSPDVANGFVFVTFKNADTAASGASQNASGDASKGNSTAAKGKSKATTATSTDIVSGDSLVDQITFQGDKPSTVK
jgi:hypothetical protein